MEVQIGRWSTVLPLQPAESRVEPLNPLCNYFAYASYQKRVLFFDQAPENAASILRQSLAKALDYFYPFAGQVSFKRTDVQLQLHCNNVGARFVEAATSASLVDLGMEIVPSEFTDQLSQMEIVPEYPWSQDYPLLSIQVTRFSCGGLSLGVSFSHQICDGVGFWYFMQSWAEIARLGTLSAPPTTSYEFEEGKIPDELPMTLVTISRKGFLQTIRKSGWKNPKEDRISPVKVNLTKSKLAELKSAAPGCTTFAVTCAYCWQRAAKTWTTSSGNDIAKLVIPVSCRGKTSWVSSNYFGNAAIPCSVTLTVSQLQNDSLALITGVIQKVLAESCTKQSIEDAIRAVHAYDENEEQLVFAGSNDFVKLSIVVSSPRHPIYKIDFGWGRGCKSTFGAQDLGPNKIFLFPSPQEDGAIDAIVALEADSVPLFLQQT